MRTRPVPAFLLLLALALGPPTPAQDSGITFESTQLADGIFMIEGKGGFGGGNVGLLTGDDGVVLIDDGLPPLAGSLLAAVAKVADGDVDFLINTHVHGDHIGGNEMLGKAGAVIVAHDKLRERMIAEGVPGAEGTVAAPKAALPVLTFADSVTIHLNGMEAFVFHLEKAHTDGDAAILFREANVLHAGDVLFNRIFPFVDLDSGGSVDGYIAGQKKMLSMVDDETKIIAGHGPLATRADLAASVEMLEAASAAVRALVAAGKSEEDVLAAKPLAEFESWSWQFITTERMVKMLYRDATERAAR